MSAASPATSLRQDATVISLVGFAHGTSHFFHFMIRRSSVAHGGVRADVHAGGAHDDGVLRGLERRAGAGGVRGRPVRGAARPHRGIALLSASASCSRRHRFRDAARGGHGRRLGNSVFHPADFTLLNRRVSTTRLGHAFSVHGLSGSLGGRPRRSSWSRSRDLGLARLGGHGGGGGRAGTRLPLRQSVAAARCALAWPNRNRLPADLRFPRRARVWMCFVFFFFTVMAFGILQNFAAPIFERSYGLSLALATSGSPPTCSARRRGRGRGVLRIEDRYQERNVAFALSVAALCAVTLATGAVPPLGSWPSWASWASGRVSPGRRATCSCAARPPALRPGRLRTHLRLRLFRHRRRLACAPIVFGPSWTRALHPRPLGRGILQTLAIATALSVGTRSRPALNRVHEPGS